MATSTIMSQLVKMQKKNGSSSSSSSYTVNRAGRLYWNHPIPFDTDVSENMPGSARALEQYTLSPVANLENPLVIGAIAAGVLGVAIIATIMLGVWIKSKLMSHSGRSRRAHHRQRGTEVVDSTTIVSSISTLDASFTNANNSAHMESIRLDDTTLDLSLMEQQPMDGEISSSTDSTDITNINTNP